MLNHMIVGDSEKSQLPQIFKNKKHRDVGPDDLPNREEITDHEMWRMFSSWSPQEWMWGGTTEWEGDWGTLTILYCPVMNHAGGGYAVWAPYSSRDYKKKDFKPRYFSWIQCKHEFVHKLLGNCWHGYTCSKCGAQYDVDSSG